MLIAKDHIQPEDVINASLRASKEDVRELSHEFSRYGYCKISQFFPKEWFDIAYRDVDSLLERFGKRIDILMKETSDSPRFMTTISATQISKHGNELPILYGSETLKEFLSQITGMPVTSCPWEGEKYIINRQERKGDTHGWHWGDYPYAVIWVLKAPPQEFGGMLQCVPHTSWDKEKPNVNHYLTQHPIHTFGHDSGDVYFLKSDTTLHRVVPLSDDKERIILNFTYSNPIANEKVSHETMNKMYDI